MYIYIYIYIYIFITYFCERYLNTDFGIANFLFGSVKLTKNNDPNKHQYSDYHSKFSFTDGSTGKNIIIF